MNNSSNNSSGSKSRNKISSSSSNNGIGSGGNARVEDLWSKIEHDTSIEMNDFEQETTILFVGDSSCGKTSLINSFLKSTSTKQPKPTFALDYSFARKKNTSTSTTSGNSGNNATKFIAHIWELGGDIQEPALLDIPISVKNLKNLSIIIVCDLSKPHNTLQSVRQWIKLCREIISRRLNEYNQLYPENPIEMDEVRHNQYQSHNDENIVSLSKIPMYLVGNKYDIFKDIGSSERRATIQIIRFLCHYYGLYYTTSSIMDAGLREHWKTLINSVCFKNPLRPMSDIHFDRPVHISPGKDTFESILLGSKSGEGGPESQPVKGTTQSKSRLAATESDLSIYLTSKGLTRECWNRLAEHLQLTLESGPDEEIRIKKTSEDQENTLGPEAEYPEPEIDEMRSQRDIILRRYVQEIERKEAIAMRMMAQGVVAGASGGGVGGSDGNDAGGHPLEAKEDGEESKSQRSSKRSSRK